MSLFQCEKCGCAENTSASWSKYWASGGEPLCSACTDGTWHGKFPREFLPKGEFITNNDGNLEHIETGESATNFYRNTEYPSRDNCCYTCPFAFTDASERAQGYGCLPTPHEILQMRTVHGKTWACHYDANKPCAGAIAELKRRGEQFKVLDPALITVDQEEPWPGVTND